LVANMIEHHDHTDEFKWNDQELVDWHNELVDILSDPDIMPRKYKEALGELACVRFEIEKRVEDIGLEIEEY